jgi:hypothetical protein
MRGKDWRYLGKDADYDCFWLYRTFTGPDRVILIAHMPSIYYCDKYAFTIYRKTKDPESPPFRERGFDLQFQVPIFDGGEVRVRHVEVRVRLDAVILPLVEQTFVAVELILQPELQPGLVFVLCFP